MSSSEYPPNRSSHLLGIPLRGHPQTLRFTSPPSFSPHPICCQVLPVVCPNHLSHPFIPLHPHHCMSGHHSRVLPLVSPALSCPPTIYSPHSSQRDLPKFKSGHDLPQLRILGSPPHYEHNSEIFLWTATPCVAWPQLTLPTLSPNILSLTHSTPATPATGQVHSHLRAFAYVVPSTTMPFPQLSPWWLLFP